MFRLSRSRDVSPEVPEALPVRKMTQSDFLTAEAQGTFGETSQYSSLKLSLRTGELEIFEREVMPEKAEDRKILETTQSGSTIS